MTAPESPDTPLCAPVAAANAGDGATEPENAWPLQSINRTQGESDAEWHRIVDEAHEDFIPERPRGRRAVITQIGPHSYRGEIHVGTMVGTIYTWTKRGCERSVRRELQRMAKRDAWRDASITWVVDP